jgi:tetratricopeptide (TPR) repeat protein
MLARTLDQNYKLLVIGLILVVGFFIYSNTFYSPFYFDDNKFIVNNPAIRNILDPVAIWNFSLTRFIVFLSLALNYHFHQLNVLGYHFFNLLIHLGAASVVWRLVMLIFSTPALREDKLSKNSKSIALFTALIFLAHPLQTESVTYIWQRSTCLAGFFYLACVYLYLKSRVAQIAKKPWLKPYISSILLAILGLFTKENTVTLPAAITLCEFCFLGLDKRRDYKYTIPFWFLFPVIPALLYLSRSYSLSTGWQYFLTQIRVMMTYIRLVFIPLRQNLDYDYPLAKNFTDLSVLWAFVCLSGIMVSVIRVFSKYRIISFSVLWFFLTLLPDSSFVPLEDVIFEHRLYLSIVGFSLFLTSLIGYSLGHRSFRAMVAVLLIVTGSYAMLTYRRNFTWQDEIRLWNDVVAKSPDKARPYYNRGVVYWERGNVEQAISDFSKAIARNPNNYALAYYNRGVAYDEQGRFLEALADYTRAIQVNPSLAEPYNNRGNLFKRAGNLAQAYIDFNKAIEVNPHLAEAYVNRGAVYALQGDFNQAILDFSKSIEINPGYVIAYTNRGNVHAHQGDFAQAIADFARGIAVDPGYAGNYIHRGHVYLKIKEYDKAWADVHKAEELGYVFQPEFIAQLKEASGKSD